MMNNATTTDHDTLMATPLSQFEVLLEQLIAVRTDAGQSYAYACMCAYAEIMGRLSVTAPDQIVAAATAVLADARTR